MAYYIKDKEYGEWQVYGCEGDWLDDDDNVMYGYCFLYGDKFDYASDFPTAECAENAIINAEEDLEDYEIVEVL